MNHEYILRAILSEQFTSSGSYFDRSPVGMRHWHVHVLRKLAIESVDSEAICAPIQIKHVHSSMPYQQVIHPKYDRRGHEWPSGYGPLSLYSTTTQNSHIGGLDQREGIPTCWYQKMLKFALPQKRTLKFALPPTPTPNANRWNIGGVGSPMQISCVDHVHFIFL